MTKDNSLKRFALLWLNGQGGNEHVLSTKAANPMQAARNFRDYAPTLPDDGYQTFPNGGAWCVAEFWQPFS